MILLILLLLSVIANIAAAYGLHKALQTKESYDAYFEELKSRLEKTIDFMKSVDIKGSFEADDEVGSVFQDMKAIIESLDIFLIGDDSEETS